jgi:hypothetical protein
VTKLEILRIIFLSKIITGREGEKVKYGITCQLTNSTKKQKCWREGNENGSLAALAFIPPNQLSVRFVELRRAYALRGSPLRKLYDYTSSCIMWVRRGKTSNSHVIFGMSTEDLRNNCHVLLIMWRAGTSAWITVALILTCGNALNCCSPNNTTGSLKRQKLHPVSVNHPWRNINS